MSMIEQAKLIFLLSMHIPFFSGGGFFSFGAIFKLILFFFAFLPVIYFNLLKIYVNFSTFLSLVRHFTFYQRYYFVCTGQPFFALSLSLFPEIDSFALFSVREFVSPISVSFSRQIEMANEFDVYVVHRLNVFTSFQWMESTIFCFMAF